MKQNFEIYPAVFVLTANRQNQLSILNHFESDKAFVIYKETQNGIDLAYPHIHYGNCVINASHTQFTLYLTNKTGDITALELPDNLLRQLKTEIFQGKNFVITFVRVDN